MPTQKKKAQKEKSSIKSTMISLETLLKKMENSDTSIEESLKLFEEGISLVRQAQHALVEAEQKVQFLIEQDGELNISEYREEDDES